MRDADEVHGPLQPRELMERNVERLREESELFSRPPHSEEYRLDIRAVPDLTWVERDGLQAMDPDTVPEPDALNHHYRELREAYLEGNAETTALLLSTFFESYTNELLQDQLADADPAARDLVGDLDRIGFARKIAAAAASPGLPPDERRLFDDIRAARNDVVQGETPDISQERLDRAVEKYEFVLGISAEDALLFHPDRQPLDTGASVHDTLEELSPRTAPGTTTVLLHTAFEQYVTEELTAFYRSPHPAAGTGKTEEAPFTLKLEQTRNLALDPYMSVTLAPDGYTTEDGCRIMAETKQARDGYAHALAAYRPDDEHGTAQVEEAYDLYEAVRSHD